MKILVSLFFFLFEGMHKRGAGNPATRLQQKSETKKEAYGRLVSELVTTNLKNTKISQIKCELILSNVFILVADFGERDYLPHQEAVMKAGLEKAMQHKDKLLEYDRNR